MRLGKIGHDGLFNVPVLDEIR